MSTYVCMTSRERKYITERRGRFDHLRTIPRSRYTDDPQDYSESHTHTIIHQLYKDSECLGISRGLTLLLTFSQENYRRHYAEPHGGMSDLSLRADFS